MVKLPYHEYKELKDWMCSVYEGCPLTIALCKSLAFLGIPERYVEGVEEMLKEHHGEYCDDVFDKIDSQIVIE